MGRSSALAPALALALSWAPAGPAPAAPGAPGLKARIVRLSSDKRVFLLNKGREDGLADGQHATFHGQKGKAFRAEALRLSPSRSVWQIYLLHDADAPRADRALVVRAASPMEKAPDPGTRAGGAAARARDNP